MPDTQTKKIQYSPKKPFLSIKKDFFATVHKYDTPKQFWRDLFLFVFGIGNFVLGLKDVAVGIARLDGNQVGFGFANIFRGLTQIIASPLSILRIIPRGLLTIKDFCVPPKPDTKDANPAVKETSAELKTKFEQKRDELMQAKKQADAQRPQYQAPLPPGKENNPHGSVDQINLKALHGAFGDISKTGTLHIDEEKAYAAIAGGAFKKAGRGR